MIETFETVAKAIADPSRVRILKLLEGGELCVCQVTTVLGLANATVSKHLAGLKTAGLILARREGKWVYYRLADKALNPYSLPFLALVASLLQDDPILAEDRRLLTLANGVPVQILCDQGRQALETSPCCGAS